MLHFWSLFFWFVITFQCTCPNPHCTSWHASKFLFKFLSFFLQNTNKNLNRKEKNTSLFMYKKYVYTICTLYVYHMYTECILYVHLSSANSKLSLRQKDFQRNAAGHSDLCLKNRPKSQFCVKRYHNHYPSALDFCRYKVWNVKFDELDFFPSLNWIFLPAVACKIQVWNRLKIKFIKLDISN